MPTNQIVSPLGVQITFPGRPVDVALSHDGRLLGVLNRDQLLTFDAASGKIIDTAKISGSSYKGIGFTPDGKHLFASTLPSSRSSRGDQALVGFSVGEDGRLSKPRAISVNPSGAEDASTELSTDGETRYGSRQAPAGFVITPDGSRMYVALNLANVVAEIDLASGKAVRWIPVGNAPYDVALAGEKLYVSNMAGRLPKPGEPTGPSGRAPVVKVDPRNIASEGSVSVVDLKANRSRKEIVVGRYAAGLAVSPDGEYVAVACANNDTVSVIDSKHDEVVQTISVHPAPDLPFGSSPNALAFSTNGKWLYVANGANNAIAVVEFAPPNCRLRGCIPTGWYPGSVVCDTARNRLIVANVKGIGSRNTEWEGKRIVKGEKVYGFNSRDSMGSISLVPLPSLEELKQQTAAVLANNRSAEIVAVRAPPRQNVPPVPIPERHGEPSLLKHVFYIIKENRTYDQVFGDLPQGEGDEKLCIYGREVTPNHHKLAEEFVLLDNFYCSGVLSADGHQWTDEAYATDYLEKAFGGFPRSYPYSGGDALAYAPSGFIWDHVLEHKKTFRVYGEFVSASVTWKDPNRKKRPTFMDCYQDYLAGNQQIDIRATANIKTIEPYLCQSFIGFPNIVSDQYRAGEFIEELKEFERRGEMPNFSIMLLPNDHTSGTRPGMPVPEAQVADNDLALGRIVEAISHSQFWKDTCIFVVQDDPQNGFDHIDGHRTVALVISPYTKRKFVDSTNYNQTGMVRTIELLLGLPTMNQFDSSATAMRNCFMDQPDLTPFTAVPNNIPLDHLNPQLSDIRDARQLYWARKSIAERLDEIDEADEDTLNRILWFAARGDDATYPAWAISLDPDDGDDKD
ncbi:MAG: bifunctional YncE family protein/alkaline phosphatase family protein [Pirellulales bacterium]|nr:bifunctional YncE family protein/alkaline phosphatase family protein [Pirellulales bacterium]